MTVDFPGPTVPSDGGLHLLKQTETKFNFLSRRTLCFGKARDPTRAQHSVAELLSQQLVLLVPLGVATSKLAVPALPAGVVAVIEVELITIPAVAAVPPIVTTFAPMIITNCPPASGPDVKQMDVTVGSV
jgi:Transposase DDE domain group 1